VPSSHHLKREAVCDACVHAFASAQTCAAEKHILKAGLCSVAALPAGDSDPEAKDSGTRAVVIFGASTRLTD
jgi:hypothetical protein